MYKKNKTLIDIDGVLSIFDRIVLDYAEKTLHIKINLLDGDDIWDITSRPELMPYKDDLWNYILNTPNLIKNMELYPYAKELVSSLRNVSQVIACTSAIFPGTFTSERVNWLIEYLDFKKEDIIITSRKEMICANFLIDDKPENIQRWAETNPKGMAILFQTPGRNKFKIIKPMYNIIYANSYLDVINIINSIVK